MDEVYRAMPEAAKDQLHSEIGDYVHDIVSYAMQHLDQFAEPLARAIAGTYAENESGERFILDPTRTDALTEAALFLDQDGQIVAVRNPELVRVEKVKGELGVLLMKKYQSYQVLTGPLAGQTFGRHDRPLPAEPAYRPGVVRGVPAAQSAGPNPARPAAAQGAKALSIFLCHASEDKEPVRQLYTTLRKLGYDPWLDEEKLLPGQVWDREIQRAVRQAHVVLVCLSGRSEKRGYVQKEIVRALDVADEQPEGTIYIIPVRLEECAVPDRLSKWQWVDLFTANGFGKLEAALAVAAQKVGDL